MLLKKKIANLLGIGAEILIIIILKIKLHQILHHRYKCPFGEIDIISYKKNCLFFTEVKYRSKRENIENSICIKQKNRIKKAALYFLSKQKFNNTDMKFIAYFVSPIKITKDFIL